MIDLHERWQQLFSAIGAGAVATAHTSAPVHIAGGYEVASEHAAVVAVAQAHAGSAGDALFQQLHDRYSDSHRSYHNLNHIRDCLAEFDRIEYQAKQPLALQWAIWFHDAIYDPNAKDNEERSAEWACQAAKDVGQPSALISAVKEMILATKHDKSPRNHDDELIVDIDLSILGQPAAKFDAYDAGIRSEYVAVPEYVYRQERTKILKAFLNRPHIYCTAPFRGRYEAMARANLERAIKRMK